ncbi:hypothetical protein GCM10027299_22070 [Larkinella ripae]
MNAGKITRRRSEANFTVLSNSMLQDRRMSWKARGLLAYLLSLPEDWHVYKTELQNHSERDGRFSTDAAFEELVEFGYIKAVMSRNEKGQMLGYNYNVYEIPLVEVEPNAENQQSEPNVEKPTSGKPTSGLPTSGNPTLQRTNKDKELKEQSIDRVNAGEAENDNPSQNPEGAAQSPPVAPAPPLPEWDLEEEVPPDLMAEYEAEMQAALSWIQNTAVNLHRPESWIRSHITEYIAEMRATDQDKGRTYQDVKKHCYYWLKEQHQRQLRNEPRTNQNPAVGTTKAGVNSSGAPKRTAFIAPGSLRRNGP